MRDSRKESIGVRWEIDSRRAGLEVQDCPNEGGVLVGEAIVLLSGPGAGLEVVDACDVAAPCAFS